MISKDVTPTYKTHNSFSSVLGRPSSSKLGRKKGEGWIVKKTQQPGAGDGGVRKGLKEGGRKEGCGCYKGA